MSTAPLPQNEFARLAALRHYEVLDTGPEPEFDDIARLATTVCETSIALISLVDADRLWFKSKIGFDASEGPRDVAFCAHAIHGDQVFEVPDAQQDDRFRDNPFVCGPPHIRFYAGAPLKTSSGHKVGTLCVLDRVPRLLTTPQRMALAQLGRQVIAQLELKTAHRKLSVTFALQQAILDNVASRIIVVTDSNGIITLMNRNAEHSLGYVTAEVAGRQSPEIFHDASEMAARAAELSHATGCTIAPGLKVLLELARQEQTQVREWTYVRKDGSRFPVLFSFNPIRDERQAIVGYVATAHDLTKRKAQETIVRRQQQAMDSAMDGIAVMNDAGEYLYLNRAHATLFGYDRPDELVGQSWRILTPEAEVSRIEQKIFPLLRAAGKWQGETLARRRDGTLFHGGVSLTLVEGVGLICVCRDISEWKRTEEQLRLSEQRQELALAGADLGLWDWNVRTGEVLFDARWCGMLGYRQDELQPRVDAWLSLLHPEDRPDIEAKLHQHFKDTTIGYEVQFRLRHKLGHWVWILARGKVVELDVSGAPLRMTGTHMDITARREVEQALVAAKDAAESASRAKSEFLAMMSHEIRTPLNGVIGFTEMLLDSTLTEDQQGFARTIKNSGEALLTIINDILDFSKIEAGKLSIERIPFDLRENLAEVVKLVSPQAAEKRIALNFEYPDALPSQIVSDPCRVYQVVLNLVSNAMRFTPKNGRITARVSFAPGRQDRWLRVSVSDTGIGIPHDKQPLLFRKFVQADSSTTRRFGGTGLGLAISKALVEMMGGEIGLESVEGMGSTFWFTLPLPQAQDSLPPKRRDLDRARGEGHDSPARRPLPLEGRRVLVAEDIIANQILIRRLLEKHGCRVTLAADGQEAVDLFRQNTYDLVLMDCHMPVLDGFQATMEIRRADARRHGDSPPVRIPIIAVTADAMEGDREKCMQAGMDDYLTKPIRLPELDTVLLKWAGPDAPRTAA